MSTVVHARFADASTAARAVAEAGECAVHSLPLAAEIHTGHLREEEVPLPGTEALRGAVTGALLVGVFGALFAGLVIWPMNGHWFGIEAVLMVFVGATLMGGVAGGLAGASEAKSSVRQAGRGLAPGQAVLTLEVDDDDVHAVCERLREEGGQAVAAA